MKTYEEPEIHIHLDEKMHSELQSNGHFESKGFIAPIEVTDFPIRDHKACWFSAVVAGLICAGVRVSSCRWR